MRNLLLVTANARCATLVWMFPTQPLTTWDRATVRAVALAYRRQRQAGELDLPARIAAEAAYRRLHPDVPERQVFDVVARMIASVVREHPKWFWRGVREVPSHLSVANSYKLS